MEAKNLEKVLEYIQQKGESGSIYESAYADRMPYDNYLILESSAALGWNYINPLEKYLENQNIGLGFSDKFICDKNGKVYYTQDYHMGYNFIMGDGYILGEDEAENLEPEDILQVMDKYALSGKKNNIWELPKNGELFAKLDEGKFGHHLEFPYRKYYAYTIKYFIERHPNWVFIMRCCDYTQLIAIKLNSEVLGN